MRNFQLMRHFLIILLTLLSFVAGSLDVHAYEYEGIYYNTDTWGGTASVTYLDRNYASYSGKVVIPSTIPYAGGQLRVTSIGYRAFRESVRLQSVSIPESVTKIDDEAFYGCTLLASIDLPESVTSIGSNVFGSCTLLRKVSFASIESFCRMNYPSYSSNPCNNVHRLYIGGKEVTDVTVPEGITSLKHTFAGCTNLKSVTLPSTLQTIDDFTFHGCSNLTEIAIPESVNTIGKFAFEGCSNLERLHLPEGITTIGEYTFRECTSLREINIPSTVTKIDRYAFEDCTALETASFASLESLCSIEFKDNTSNPLVYSHRLIIDGEEVTEVVLPASMPERYYTFSNCSNLTKVTIPGSLNNIGRIFGGCTGIRELVIEDSDTSINLHNTFNDSPIERLYLGRSASDIFGDANPHLTHMVIGNKVTTLGDRLFKGCTALSSIDLPPSVTSIGQGAFGGCTGLSTIDFPSSMTSIGYGAFSGCTGLTEIHIPSSITRIDSEAFKDCTGIKEMTISGKDITLGQAVLKGCSSLESFTYHINKDRRFYELCGGTYNSYNNGLLVNLKSLTLLSGEIAENEFSYCRSLRSVTLPPDLTSIPREAFYSCSNLQSITIPASVTNIGSYAFVYCDNLQKSTFASIEALCSINFNGSGANPLDCAHHLFIDDEEVTELIVPEGVETLRYTFTGCSNLKSVTLPESLHTIGPRTFWGCTGLTTIVIPKNVTSIEGEAFYGCTGLSTFVVPKNVTKIEDYAFRGCKIEKVCNFSALSLSKGSSAMGEIARYADVVYNCERLTETDGYQFVTTSEGQNILWNYVGQDTTLTLPPCHAVTATGPIGIYTIGDWAFYGAGKITSITIPEGITTIGQYAFAECPQLDNVNISEGIVTIGQYAFKNCPLLANVNIPTSVTTIDNDAFGGCTHLQRATFASIASLCTINFISSNSNPLNYAHHLYLADPSHPTGSEPTEEVTEEVTELIIPDEVTTIGNFAFIGCSSIHTAILPTTLESIGNCSFLNCSNLKTVMSPSKLSLTKGSSSNGYAAYYASILINIDENAEFEDLDGFYFVKDDKETWHLWKYAGSQPNVTLPVRDEGYLIEEYCFRGNSEIASITIPESITTIPPRAFSGCSHIESIVMPAPSGIFGIIFGSTSYDGSFPVTVNGYTYYIPTSLSEVTITKGEIASSAFKGITSLEKVTLCEGVTRIGYEAFEGCKNLAEITIPSSVSKIDNDSFNDCPQLTKVSYPSIEALCNIDFTSIKASPSYYAHHLYIGDTEPTEIVIPDGIVELKYHLVGCTSLRSLIIPASVTSIYTGTLHGCSNIETLTVPNINTHIGKYFGEIAYDGAKKINTYYIPQSLQSVIVLRGEIPGNAFQNCNMLTTITFGNDVTQVSGDPIPGCSQLKNLIIADSSNTIKMSGNYKGSSLEYVYVGRPIVASNTASSKITSPFASITSLKTVRLGNGLTSVATDLLKDCSGLTEITIPASVKTIGSGAFSGCTNLQKAIFADIETLCNITFGDATSNPLYYAHHLYVNATTPSSDEGEEVIELNLPESVTTISSYAFAGCSSFKHVYIPQGVTVKKGAFSDCSGLQSMTFHTLTTLANCFGTTSFEGSYKARDVYAPEGLTEVTVLSGEIKDYAFAGFSSLTTINLPQDITKIGYDAFSDCSGLTSFAIPETVTTIQGQAFQGCKGLTEITIPQSVKNISNGAFEDCTNLQKATFANVHALCNIYFGSETAHPCYYAHHLYFLEPSPQDKISSGQAAEVFDIVVPDDISSIRRTFIGCSSLKSVIIPPTVSYVAEGSLYGCSAIETLAVPSINKHIGECFGTTPFDGTSKKWYFSTLTGASTYYYMPQTLKSATVHNGKINDMAFIDTKLSTVVLGKDVSYITFEGFTGCSMDSLILADSTSEISFRCYFYSGPKYTYIGRPIEFHDNSSSRKSPFQGASNLERVDLGEGVSFLLENMFAGCDNLQEVHLPSSLSYIRSQAFYNCKSLTDLYVHALRPPMCYSNVFMYVNQSACNLYVPEEALSAYEQADQWKDFFVRDIITDIDGVEVDGQSAEALRDDDGNDPSPADSGVCPVFDLSGRPTTAGSRLTITPSGRKQMRR